MTWLSGTRYRQAQTTRSSGLGRVYLSQNRRSIRCHSSDKGDISRIRDKIGGDYGEGFFSVRNGTRLDIDAINESMKVTGAERMKYAMHPDRAYGLVYDLDVFIDIPKIKAMAWNTVADMHGYPRFDFNGRPQSHIDEMMPEKVVLYVFKWTDDIKKARAVVYDFNQVLVQTVLRHGVLTQESARVWLDLVGDFQIPCALVSFFDRKTIISLLEILGMESKFAKVVTADDEVENRSQAYLKASIELQRPPEQCAVFCTTVESITAAHNCTMRAIAIVGRSTAPQLSNADLTILNFEELTIYNIRRIFANGGSNFMDLKKAKGYDSSEKPSRIRNAIFPDDS
jgi:beta-phosphoglucomutase-like phosphatase (HAD superfamily)